MKHGSISSCLRAALANLAAWAGCFLMAGAAMAADTGALPGDIVDASRQVVPSAYKAIAARFGEDAGIAYRYGPGPADYGTTSDAGLPTWFQRADKPFVSDQQGGQRPCQPRHCGHWQVGTWGNEVGGYSSNIGHVAFVPDDPALRVGVTDLAISSVSNAVFSQRPELSWTLYGQGLDDINAVTYKAQGKDVSRPVALARCQGRPGWCLSSIMVFRNGLVAAAGNNTARNLASVQLAPGKVPTAIAITNSSEFALVTVWDTVNIRGEIAVIALAGLGDGATTDKPDSHPAEGGWWGEWRAPYPGLPNLGNVAYMKVIGYVPLPDMKAPTEISVTTGHDRGKYLAAGTPGYTSPSDRSPLTIEKHRQDAMPTGGGAWEMFPKAAVAVVISKSEQKVSFVDLKSLFDYYLNTYFGRRADFDKTMRPGDGDAVWPFTFTKAPSQKPTIIKTVNLDQRPTAVKTYAWGVDPRVWIATQDGRLQTWSLGGYPGRSSPDRIRPIGSVAVGRNPTAIALPKEKAGSRIYPDVLNEVIVVSRGDRRIDWVRFSAQGGKVVRTLKDARLKDPIAAEDTDNHSTESYVLSIADYGGRALRNYRYGPVIMHNYRASCQPPDGCGMGNSGNDPFEYGGAFETPGRAFQITGANIP